MNVGGIVQLSIGYIGKIELIKGDTIYVSPIEGNFQKEYIMSDDGFFAFMPKILGKGKNGFKVLESVLSRKLELL